MTSKLDKKAGIALITDLLGKADKDGLPKQSRKTITDILQERDVPMSTAYDWYKSAFEEWKWEEAKQNDPVATQDTLKRRENLDRIDDIARAAQVSGNEELALKASVAYVNAEINYKKRSNRLL
tara:strand:+ start:36 stop:407 length:372 start_codon:yes stop_codon:yes gene_type:complete